MWKNDANCSVQTGSEYEPIGEESRPLLAQVNHSLSSPDNINSNKKNKCHWTKGLPFVFHINIFVMITVNNENLTPVYFVFFVSICKLMFCIVNIILYVCIYICMYVCTLTLPVKSFWTVRFLMFFKEFSSPHQACIYLQYIIQNTAKAVILWNIFTI